MAALLLLACLPLLRGTPSGVPPHEASAVAPPTGPGPATPAAVPSATAPAAHAADVPAAAAPGAHAAAPPGTPSGTDPPARPAPEPLPGMVLAVDPETGEFGMPSPEQLAELRALAIPEINTSAMGLVEVHHPDGSVSIDLQGRFQEYSMVRIAPDGTKTFHCNNASHAACRTAGTRPPGPALEVR